MANDNQQPSANARPASTSPSEPTPAVPPAPEHWTQADWHRRWMDEQNRLDREERYRKLRQKRLRRR